MDLVLIELILWVGLLFFFWMLKEGLGQVESDIESLGLMKKKRLFKQETAFCKPEHVVGLIGSYRDQPIYRYAMIQGKTYQFDRVCPPECGMTLDEEERFVAPGLVYQECNSATQPFADV